MKLERTADVVSVALAKEAHRKLGSARAHEARDADDFAFFELEGDVVHHRAVGI
ncbi:hypothetical protein SDC9_117484 [bioreactor metagenome]|uniref:Uncharacterized protein n=1 Tax=bioreactor metagenome TaxID=1076179 RepID=A0A645BYV4_9ZZZZ